VLVPLMGAWTADYEEARQILTIDGTKALTPPSPQVARSVFGEDARNLAAAWPLATSYPIAVVRDIKDFPGGRLAVQFKLVSGATDQTAGIVFNLQPDGTYLYARYNTKDGNVAVWKFENGARAVLMHGAAHEQLPFGQWHTLDVVVSATAVTATVNGRLVVRHALDRPVTGRVGVWTKADSVTAFRAFQAAGQHHQIRGGGATGAR
jgi:hypothetical protein